MGLFSRGEGSPSRGGKARFQTSAALRLHLIIGKASGVNLEDKSGVETLRRTVNAQHYLPAAPAVKLAPNRIGSSFPLDTAGGTERGMLTCGQPSVSI